MWHQLGRSSRLWRDTGGESPLGGSAEAELWLGVHRAGTVPQGDRTVAANRTGDDATWARELAAMPETTPTERARRAWVVASRDLEVTGDAGLDGLRSATVALPAGEDGSDLEAWLAVADAAVLHGRHDPGWLDPLLAAWPTVSRVPRRRRHSARVWPGSTRRP